MKKLLAVAVATACLAGLAEAQARRSRAAGEAGEWTGYVTDTHCGMKGANARHTAECVNMCVKGGARPQLFNQADQKLYFLDSLDKVKDLIGVRVTVKGTLSSDGTAIAVSEAGKAASPELP
jgi:hypothetical protein